MLLDELVKVHRVNIVTITVGKSGNVAGRYGMPDPLSEFSPFLGGTRKSATLRDLPQSPETFSRQRTEHGVACSKKSLPRNRVVRRKSLAHFCEGNGREIEHRLRCKQVEVSHRFIRTGNHEIDLIRLDRERGIVPLQRFRLRDPSILRR